MQTNNYSNKKRKTTNAPKKRPRKSTAYKKNAAYNTNKMLKKLFKNKEYKCVDISENDAITAANDGMRNYFINGAVQGTQFFQRLGSKFTMKSVQLRVQIYPNIGQEFFPAEFISIKLVYDKNPNGNYPVSSDLYLSTFKDGQVTGNAIAFPPVTNRSRFRVLREWNKYMPAIQSVANGGNVVAPWLVGGSPVKGESMFAIDEYIKLKDLPTTWLKANLTPGEGGNTGELAECVTGALYLIAMKSNVTNQSTWNMNFNARVVFEDN